MHVSFIASENGALTGGKVGGLGDVIRDAPVALNRLGHTVSVLTPGYQSLSRLPGAIVVAQLQVPFSAGHETVSLYRIESNIAPGITHWLLEHPVFASCGEGVIYCVNDSEPFAMDAKKFALFCSAACQAFIAGAIPKPDVLHLHDWHSAAFLLLRAGLPEFRQLTTIPAVYTIHNLAIQGIRPFSHHDSSLSTWFPELVYEQRLIADPNYSNCINFMRTGINLADAVHTVSPTYAREILKPSDPARGFIGGEGLERDLRRINKAGKLFGILNGCEYSIKALEKVTCETFIACANSALLHWISKNLLVSSAHYLAMERLQLWAQGRENKEEQQGTPRRKGIVVASVGRLTGQKLGLLTRVTSSGATALDSILQNPDTEMYIMLGSGDLKLEELLVGHMARHRNFIFLRGFDDRLADHLYRFCDLFLMPSTFEPCGISQMQALRAGKPCLVHKVGGLADTVSHGQNGFTFAGDTPEQQMQQMLDTFAHALGIYTGLPGEWAQLCKAAAASRFSWDKSVSLYEEKIYAPLLLNRHRK